MALRGRKRKGLILGWGKGGLWEIGISENHVTVMATELYIHTKRHHTTLKWVKLVVYKFQLTKSV